MKNKKYLKYILYVLIALIIPGRVKAEDVYKISENPSPSNRNPMINMYVKSKTKVEKEKDLTSGTVYYNSPQYTKETATSACTSKGGKLEEFKYCRYYSNNVQIYCTLLDTVSGKNQEQYGPYTCPMGSSYDGCCNNVLNQGYFKGTFYSYLPCSNQKGDFNINGLPYSADYNYYSGCVITSECVWVCLLNPTPEYIEKEEETELQSYESFATKDGKNIWAYPITSNPNYEYPPTSEQYVRVSDSEFNTTNCSGSDSYACGVARIMIAAKSMGMLNVTGAEYAAVTTALRFWAAAKNAPDADGILIYNSTGTKQIPTPIYKNTVQENSNNGYLGGVDYNKEGVIYAKASHGDGGNNGLYKIKNGLILYKKATDTSISTGSGNVEIKESRATDVDSNGKFSFNIVTNFNTSKVTVKDDGVISTTGGITLKIIKVNDKVLNPCSDDATKTCIKVEGTVEGYKTTKKCGTKTVTYELTYSFKDGENVSVHMIRSKDNPSKYQRFIVMESDTGGKKWRADVSFGCPGDNVDPFKCLEPDIKYSGVNSECERIGYVHDPNLECLINEPSLFENYDFTGDYVTNNYSDGATGEATSYVKNKYCAIKCREDIKYNFYGQKIIDNINYIKYTTSTFLDRSGSTQNVLANIEGTRECVSLIDYQVWKKDWNNINSLLVHAWNEFKKYESYQILTTRTSTPWQPEGATTYSYAPRVCNACCFNPCTCWAPTYNASGQVTGSTCCGHTCYASCAGPVERRTWIWSWPQNSYAEMAQSGMYDYTKTTRTTGPVSYGSTASCNSSCASAGCSGESGNPNYYQSAYAQAVTKYVSLLNQRERLLAYIQDCNLYVNLQLHKGQTGNGTVITDSTHTYIDQTVYLLGTNPYGNGSSSCSVQSQSCTSSPSWSGKISNVIDYDYRQTLYYKTTAGYAFDPQFSFTYDSDYNMYTKISNSSNTNNGNTEIYYPTDVYDRLPDSNGYYTLKSTAKDTTVASNVQYCADNKESNQIYYTKYPQFYETSGKCTINNVNRSSTYELVDYWNCSGKGVDAVCTNDIKVKVPKNNIAKVTVKKRTNFYQLTQFYSIIPDGGIITYKAPNSILISDERNKNIFPLEMDRMNGTYYANAEYWDVGDKNRKAIVKINNGVRKQYSCPYIAQNKITINEEENRGYGFYYRNIDLTNPFPNGIQSSVWQTDNAQKAIDRMDAKKDDTYLETPQYEFVITPQNIRSIKQYNSTQEVDSNGFNDFRLTCPCDEGSLCPCTSDFLQDISIGGKHRNLVTSYKRNGVEY